MVDADLVAADELHSDGFQLITPGGIPLTKDEYLGAIASGSVNYLLWEPEAIDARVHLDAAASAIAPLSTSCSTVRRTGQIGSGTPTTTKARRTLAGGLVAGDPRPGERLVDSANSSSGWVHGPPARFARSANVTPPSSEMVASRTSSQTSRSVQPTVIGHGSGLCLVAQLIGASWPWNSLTMRSSVISSGFLFRR